MEENCEKSPLLQNGNNHPNKSLFPPLEKSKDFSYYNGGVIEVNPAYLDNKERRLRQYQQKHQPQGIALAPIATVIAVTIVVGVVLLFSITFKSSNENNDNSLKETNLMASAEARIIYQKQSPSLGNEGHVDVSIPQGRLRGYKTLTRQKREFLAFYKVPYAEPPLRNLRFKDPVEPSSWVGLRDIPIVAPQCIQKEKYSQSQTPVAVGEEDCLYANIYTPRLPRQSGEVKDEAKLFPVMVYIHGGGLSGNGSRYGAEYFLDEEVILITFQYRIGAFGLLSTGDDVIRGNMAHKDQVQMLKWVQKNIHYFNGDPNLVTIYGNSNGGMNVGLLTISPLAKGLFHRAISQSGASICTSIPSDINESAGKGTLEEIGKQLGCDWRDSSKFLECLREKDAKDIALLQNSKIFYSLTIENGNVEESTKFMPEKPYDLLKAGKIHPVPYIIGNNNAEYYAQAIILLSNENATKVLNERFEEFGSLLKVNLTTEEMGKVKEFYFGGKITNGSLNELGDLYSDRDMVHCSYTSARFHAKSRENNGRKAYLYWMTKPAALSYLDKFVEDFPTKELGIVSHADELQFLFPYYGYPEITEDDEEYFEFSKYFVKLWVHFARTGDPNMDGNKWTPVNGYNEGYANSTYWFELNDSPGLIPGPQERMGFWDGFKHSQLNFDI